ncbi:unnamed protein product [Gordionus sp. m RMFG-2023]
MDQKQDILTQFTDCFILRDHKIFKEDIWVRRGKIIDPKPVFFDEKRIADEVYFCNNNIISPGFIDVQINGAFGIDFSQLQDHHDPNKDIQFVGEKLLKHGVTSFVPTIITSPVSYYHKILPKIKKTKIPDHRCANVLGVHLEGPFINPSKRGIHQPEFIYKPSSISLPPLPQNGALTQQVPTVSHDRPLLYSSLTEVYGSGFDEPDSAPLIITLAPEYVGADKVIEKLTREKGIRVSLGHSMANLEQGEKGVESGASFITHLFNAMLPFHHRDPGLVGLLTACPHIFYGMITDGIHTNPAAIKIAQRTLPQGLVIITDAILTMGLDELPPSPNDKKTKKHPGNLERYHSVDESPVQHFTFGGQDVIYSPGDKTAMSQQQTLAGGMTPFDACVQYFKKSTGCTLVEALECSSLHAAQALGITTSKGCLDFGNDADLVILDPDTLKVQGTVLGGKLAYQSNESSKLENRKRNIRELDKNIKSHYI